MKKACQYCGKIHDKKQLCDKKPLLSETRGTREDHFRWSYDWKLKREHIFRRDKYLCVACLNKLPGTVRKFNNEDLSVHHIRSLKTNWDLRLDDLNLITLCRFHHEAAETGTLPAESLVKILLDYPPQG